MQFCYVFDGFLSILDAELLNAARYAEEEELTAEPAFTRGERLEAVYILSCYWSLGATVVIENRPGFDDYIKRTSGLMLVQDTSQKAASIRKCLIKKSFRPSER